VEKIPFLTPSHESKYSIFRSGSFLFRIKEESKTNSITVAGAVLEYNKVLFSPTSL
tara:strand:- start:2424 stop:2591 length:168 start_codon:yes stop_codon:yes gene_type:complete